jgi:hypothetical protein
VRYAAGTDSAAVAAAIASARYAIQKVQPGYMEIHAGVQHLLMLTGMNSVSDWYGTRTGVRRRTGVVRPKHAKVH